MDNRFLITTGLEKTIPKNQPLLLLGEWCRSISQKDKFTNLNIKILPYHWDDRRKLQKDYLYLNTLYEKLLIELGEKSYVPEDSKWPVELRLLFLVVINAAMFIGGKMIMKKTGSNLTSMMNKMQGRTFHIWD